MSLTAEDIEREKAKLIEHQKAMISREKDLNERINDFDGQKEKL